VSTTSTPAGWTQESPGALRVAGLVTCIAASLPIVFALPRSGWEAATAIVPYAVFAAAFVLATASDRTLTHRRVLLALQALMSIVAAHVAPNSAALVLLVVLAAQLPHALSLRASWATLLSVTCLAATSLRDQNPVFIAVTVGVYIGFEGFALYMTIVAQRERQARTELAAALLDLKGTRALLARRARHAERERLTADLHDVLGHNLVALRVHLEAAKRLPPDAAEQHLATASETAARLLDDVRTLVRDRRDGDRVDLAAALAPLREGLPGLRVDLDVEEGLQIDDHDAAEAVVRCAQEAVTNAVRHARAERLEIAVRREGAHSICITAEDDGRGSIAPAEGGGLRGMRERAERLGGTLTTGTAAGGGFAVRMEIPVPGTTP